LPNISEDELRALNVYQEVETDARLRRRYRITVKVSVGEPAEGSLTQIQTYSTKPQLQAQVCISNLTKRSLTKLNLNQILNDGYLGSYNDEERSEVR